ncbi:MAG: hypothetical protein R3F07_10295 [Opitutaceae bacterium]
MKKLLNNPWFVGLLVAGAIVFVAQATLSKRQSAAYPASYPDEYVDDFEEVSPDETGLPAAGEVASVRQALDALSTTTPNSNPFGSRQAEIVADGSVEEPAGAGFIVHLFAIWQQNGQTLVLVNNRIQQAGDVIGDLTIESTTLDGIWLSHPDGRDFISLGSSFQWENTGSSREPNPTLALNEN